MSNFIARLERRLNIPHFLIQLQLPVPVHASPSFSSAWKTQKTSAPDSATCI